MNWWQITLLVVGVLLGVVLAMYLLSLIIAYFALKKFAMRIETRKRSIDVLLSQKYDVLVLVARIFKKNHVQMPSDFEDELSPNMEGNLKKLTLTERMTIRSFLMKTTQTILYYAAQNPSISEDNEFLVLKRSLLEIDENYRKAITLYNADAVGYNYWIGMKVAYPLRKLGHFEEKQVIVG